MKKKKEQPKENRQMWVGYYPRRTKTKREKQISQERKYKDYLKWG